MSKMVERVAKAIATYANGSPDQWQNWQEEARAAIEAMREPSEDMAHFGHGHWSDGKGAIAIWQAMIDAALDGGERELDAEA